MSSKPTIFFVHGAWHQPAHMTPIMDMLEADGYPCVCPQQPSFNLPSAQMRDFPMTRDAAAIRGALDKLIVEEERTVLVVLHSYGGVVGTEAVDASLGIRARAAKGEKGGVLRLVYMCAFILPAESSLGDAFGGKLPPIIKTEVRCSLCCQLRYLNNFPVAQPDGSCMMIDGRTRFYDQLDDAEAAKWLALCKPGPASAQLWRLSYTAYMHHPLSYIVAGEDRALLPEIQWNMIQGCRNNGLEVDVHELAADHSPWLCKTEELAAILRKLSAAA